ncbi:MAG: aminoglycoside phosphotransferase family protein [Isosphaeraceae bacterium]|nr:aminoglycoside phosphotransferase family protein [Isosphaeraceae bacterium]
MREVTPETAAAYLWETGRVPEGRAVVARALGWGVSNIVMRVDVEGEPPIVLKQARERLRTKMLWVSRLERVWTEQAALELLADLLLEGAVPRVLFADPDNYLFAMTCAPDDSVVWKEQLLLGEADLAVARQAGLILGAMHAETVGHPALRGPLADTTVFDQLRIDPFYRTVAGSHPDLAAPLEVLTDETMSVPVPTFVHADFSPKNILVHGQGLTVVDFETAHAGDPAFDLGFFLSHLLLKAVRARPHDGPYLGLIRAFWDAYHERLRDALDADPDLVRRAIAHTAACALARVDGKSPVDYLDADAQAAVRRFAPAVLLAAPERWEELLRIAAREMHIIPYSDEQEAGTS